MYYFEFLNLEAYKLINSFKSKEKICFVDEILDKHDIWNLWLVLRENGKYICIHYIWENWYSEEESELESELEEVNVKSNYKFKNSFPLTEIKEIKNYMNINL